MDGATLQAKIYAGYAKAARVMGIAYDQYRPLSASQPLGNKVATVKMAVDSGKQYTFTSPNEYGDPTWLALIDDASVLPGDYMVGNNGGLNSNTYFIAGKQFLLPVLAIECNRSLHITRQASVSGVGDVGYAGSTTAQEVDVLGTASALWPASVLFGGKSQIGVGLPAGVKNVGWRILLPPSATPTILAGDTAMDDLGRRYVIEGSEFTDLGWRLSAQEVHS
jgi:hypothetical protein